MNAVVREAADVAVVVAAVACELVDGVGRMNADVADERGAAVFQG
jgi:hypothetical protein